MQFVVGGCLRLDEGRRAIGTAAVHPMRQKLGLRGPQKAPTKERITIRLSREVVERFRATGDGWQSRVDAALQDWLDKHPRGSVQ